MTATDHIVPGRTPGRMVAEFSAWARGRVWGLSGPRAAHTDAGPPGESPSIETMRDIGLRTECLEFAISKGEKFGIWGGLSERERRKIRRERQIAAQRQSASAG